MKNDVGMVISINVLRYFNSAIIYFPEYLQTNYTSPSEETSFMDSSKKTNDKTKKITYTATI